MKYDYTKHDTSTNTKLPNNHYWMKLKDIYENSYTYGNNLKTLSSKMLNAFYSLSNLKAKFDSKFTTLLSIEDLELLANIETNTKNISAHLDKIVSLQNSLNEYTSSYYREDFKFTRYDVISILNEKMHDLPLVNLNELLEELKADLNTLQDKRIDAILGIVDDRKQNVLSTIELSLFISQQRIERNVKNFVESFIYPTIQLSEEYNVHARCAITESLGIDRLSKEEQNLLKNKKDY